MDHTESVILPSGLRATLRDACLEISLPPAQAHEQIQWLLVDLHELREQLPLARHWIVSLADLPRLPVMLLGALLSHRQDLLATDGDMELRDLHTGLLSPSSLARLQHIFS